MTFTKTLSGLMLIAALVLQTGCQAKLQGYGDSPSKIEREWELVVARDWTLTSLDGSSVEAGTQITINFEKGGALSGDAGVNSFRGGYTRNRQEALTISNLAATKKAGPAPAMDQENTFLKTLQSVDGYQLADDRLDLMRNGRVALRFRPGRGT